MVMTSVQSHVSRSLVIGFVGLEESQYQTWPYLVEIDRVTQWLPVLNGTTNISLSLSCFIALINMQQLLVVWYGD
jgi:hypothetical protein